MEEFSKVFRLKKEVTKDDFLRDILISLSKDDKAPVNVLDAKFGEIEEFTKEIIALQCDVSVNYSGSVGYDRQEEYWDKEKKRDSNGNTYYADVKKTRTVTDWKPHSGTYDSKQGKYILNENDNDELGFASLVSSQISNVKDKDIIEADDVPVDQEALRSGIHSCEFSGTLGVRWPGNHHKDENYSESSEITFLQCMIVPFYEVIFEYGGKKYRAIGAAIGEPNGLYDLPENSMSVESIETIDKRKDTAIYGAEHPRKSIKTTFIVFAVITGIVGMYGLINIGKTGCGAEVCLPLGFSLMAVCIIVAVILGVVIRKDVNKIIVKANSEKKNLNNQKVIKLVEILRKLGLREMTDEEKNGISSTDDYK